VELHRGLPQVQAHLRRQLPLVNEQVGPTTPHSLPHTRDGHRAVRHVPDPSAQVPPHKHTHKTQWGATSTACLKVLLMRGSKH